MIILSPRDAIRILALGILLILPAASGAPVHAPFKALTLDGPHRLNFLHRRVLRGSNEEPRRLCHRSISCR